MNTPDQPFSRPVADVLEGLHVMPDSLTDRVRLLAELEYLNRMREVFGWWDHTGDWDWRVTVTMNDGSTIGTTNDFEIMSDEFHVVDLPTDPYDLDLHSLPEADRKLPTNLDVAIISNDPDSPADRNTRVPILDIRSILITTA
jgi:hypothetical protein